MFFAPILPPATAPPLTASARAYTVTAEQMIVRNCVIGRPCRKAPLQRTAAVHQLLNRCWVSASPTVSSDSTASAARSTWNGSSLRSVEE